MSWRALRRSAGQGVVLLSPDSCKRASEKTKRKGSWGQRGLQRAVWTSAGKDERKKKTLGSAADISQNKHPENRTFPHGSGGLACSCALWETCLQPRVTLSRCKTAAWRFHSNKQFLFQRVDGFQKKNYKSITQSQKHKPVLMLLEKVTSTHKKKKESLSFLFL